MNPSEEKSRDGSLIRIETPEHVVFEYELAGPASRIVAAMVDLLLIGLGLFGLFLVALIVTQGTFEFAGPWALALGAVAAFALFWGYPILFEIWWRGQTPGKRSVGLRVIQEGGYALTPAVVLARNLLRIVDFLPGFYLLGLVVMIVHPRNQRVGDLVAGTLVIRDKTASTARPPAVLRVPQVPVGGEEVVAELRRGGAHKLPVDQVRLIEDFLARRGSMTPDARRRIADQLAGAVSAAMPLPRMESERLLQCVLAARRQDEAAAEGGGA
ncbi:MAG TPA: RDD family protein [Planctomycetota bacterium]